MAKSQTVHVTQEDIDRSRRNVSSKCMVANAVHREVTGALRIAVDYQTIRFTVGENRYYYLTPPPVQEYIIAYDAGAPVDPFTFRLKRPRVLPTKVLTRSGKRRNNSNISTQSGLRRSKKPHLTHNRVYGARVMRRNWKDPTAATREESEGIEVT